MMYSAGTYEFIMGPKHCKGVQRRNGPSGMIPLTDVDADCRNRPWLIEPKAGKYVYLRLKGMYLRRYNPMVHQPFNTSIRNVMPMKCDTAGRVVITTGDGKFGYILKGNSLNSFSRSSNHSMPTRP